MTVDHPISTELLYALGDVRVGDVVRVPGRDEWCVVVRLDVPGLDGVHQVGRAGLQITVSQEAMRRAAFDEFPDPVLSLCPLAEGPWRRSSGPVERMLAPSAWLRVQPTSALLAAAIAVQVVEEGSLEGFHAREALMEAAVARLDSLRRGR